MVKLDRLICIALPFSVRASRSQLAFAQTLEAGLVAPRTLFLSVAGPLSESYGSLVLIGLDGFTPGASLWMQLFLRSLESCVNLGLATRFWKAMIC